MSRQSQLLTDCLNEIFEYLEDDKINLRSCLLANRHWCEVSVMILWRNHSNCSVQIFDTLLACLPNESKDILRNNGIIIPMQTPTFNYAAFCKALSINNVDNMIELFLNKSQQSSRDDKYIIKQEMYKLFMNQTSLKKLEFYLNNTNYSTQQKVIFTSFPGTNNCLENLSELCCSSNIHSEIFYQLSQICHNIRSLNVEFKNVISNGFKDLLSVQKNIKYLDIVQYYDCKSLNDIIPSLTKLSNNLIKLSLDGKNHYISLAFISEFIHLQELELSFDYHNDCFKTFGDVTLPQLQILKLKFEYPTGELLFKFLENNGKSLKEFCINDMISDSDESLNLAIAGFCPNLRKLSTGFKNNNPETFKIVFNNCQHLESIKIWCGGIYCLSEKEALEVIMEYSNEKLCEIILYHQFYVRNELLPDELESFLESWEKQKPPFSLIVVNFDANNSLNTYDENMEIIEKYTKSGVIKKFKVDHFNDSFL